MRRLSISFWFFAVCADAATLQVGPNQRYTQPCDGISAARPGDVVEIDAAGNYTASLCSWEYSGITIRGVNGRARMDGAGRTAQDKGIWVISGADTVIENIEFFGAKSSDDNGAAIRQEGPNLTLRNCYIHDNQEGILANDSPGSQILIEFSEFGNNGSGDGYTHNIYVNHVAKFTLRYSYSHGARVGHLVKSRAAENYILYNRLTAESAGSPSYKIDLSNGGMAQVIGNVIEQSAADSNDILLAYMAEGADPLNPGKQLYVVNNTMVNDNYTGTFVATFGNHTTLPVVVKNNIFSGPGTVIDQGSALLSNNLIGGDPLFVNRTAFDYHLRLNSPAINAGADAGSLLNPIFEYVHPLCAETRGSPLDLGAFQFGSSGTLLTCPSAAPSAVRISAAGVVNAASSLGGAIAPGEIITIYGMNFGPDQLTQALPNSAGLFANELAGTQILFDGKPATLVYVTRGIVSVVVPYAISGQTSSVMQIVFNGSVSNTETIPIAPAAPAIFTANSMGAGQGTILNADGSLNKSTQPADRSSVISLFATGEGSTMPDGVDGKIAAAPLPSPILPVSVSIGSVNAEVTYAGAAPGLVAGVLQVNVRIPSGITPGPAVPLTLTIGGVTSQPAVTVAVR